MASLGKGERVETMFIGKCARTGSEVNDCGVDYCLAIFKGHIAAQCEISEWKYHHIFAINLPSEAGVPEQFLQRCFKAQTFGGFAGVGYIKM